MEYTVQKLAQMAGVSSRTLRYRQGIEFMGKLRLIGCNRFFFIESLM